MISANNTNNKHQIAWIIFSVVILGSLFLFVAFNKSSATTWTSSSSSSSSLPTLSPYSLYRIKNYHTNYPNPPFKNSKLLVDTSSSSSSSSSSKTTTLPAPASPRCYHMDKLTEHASPCPEEELYLSMWLLIRDWKRPENRDRPLTLVDVGSNKGYTISSFLEALNLTTFNEFYYTAEDDEKEMDDLLSERKINISTTNNLFRHYAPLFSRQALAFDIYEYAENLNTPTPVWRGFLFGACCDGAESSPYILHESPNANNKKSSTSSDESNNNDNNVNNSDPENNAVESASAAPSTLAEHIWMKKRTGDVYVPKVEIFTFDATHSHVKYTKHFFNSQLKKYNRQFELAVAAAKTAQEKKTIMKMKTEIVFHMYRAAVSNRTGEMNFCGDQSLGMEFGSLCSSGGVVTPIVTLDSFPALQKVDTIDFLVIDTEGHDFAVFRHKGFRKRFLKPGKVAIMLFELHKGPDKTPLSQVVEDLTEKYGYTCYFPVHGNKLRRHVARVSPMQEEGCWSDRYDTEARGWKNMVCAHFGNFPELKLVFDELSKMPKDEYFYRCPLKAVKKKFFDKFPGRNWDWATQKLRMDSGGGKRRRRN